MRREDVGEEEEGRMVINANGFQGDDEDGD